MLVRGATGKPVRHHRTYELTLWDQRILRTRISRPINTSTYAASTWAHILRHQLEVSADEFWDCALNGLAPDRGEPVIQQLDDALPLFLFRQLQQLGIPDNEIAILTPATAAELIAQKYRELEPQPTRTVANTGSRTE